MTHQKDKKTCDFVEVSTIAGRTYEQIANVLGITRKTLVKHYKHNLERGAQERVIKCVNEVQNLALTEDYYNPHKFKALKLILKNTIGWTEGEAQVQVDNRSVNNLISAEPLTIEEFNKQYNIKTLETSGIEPEEASDNK